MTASFHLKFVSQDTIYTWRTETHILLGPPDNVQLSGQALQHLITEGSLSWNVADDEHGYQCSHLCFCGSFALDL